MTRFLLPVAALLIGAPTVRAADSYRTYTNARFGSVVQYPSNLLAPRAESEDGAQRKFVSRDGTIVLTFFATPQTYKRTLAQLQIKAIRDWKLDEARITYSKRSSQWFVLSGYMGDAIFYEKTVLWNGAFHTIIWQYPRAQRQRMDAPVTRAVRGFEAKNFSRVTAKPIKTPTSPPKPRARDGY